MEDMSISTLVKTNYFNKMESRVSKQLKHAVPK